MAPTMALDSPLDGYTVNGTRLGSALLKMVAQYTFRRTAQVISNPWWNRLKPVLTVLSRSCLRFKRSTPILTPTRLLV